MFERRLRAKMRFLSRRALTVTAGKLSCGREQIGYRTPLS